MFVESFQELALLYFPLMCPKSDVIIDFEIQRLYQSQGYMYF